MAYPSNRRDKKPKPVITDISDTMIASYGDELAGLDQQIKDLQDAKKGVYANVREHHGKKAAKSLKLAVSLHGMDSDKRTEVEEIDAEAQRMLTIIERGTSLANSDDAHVARGAREQIAHNEDGEIIENTEPAHTDRDPVGASVVADGDGLPSAVSNTEPASASPEAVAADAEEAARAPASSDTQSTAARKDVPESDELAGPVHNQDGGSLAPQNDRAGGSVESGFAPKVVAGVESVTVGRVTQPEASPRSNGSQAGTQAPPVDTIPETPEPGAPAATGTAHNPIPAAVPGSINGDGIYSYDWLRRHDRCLDPDGCKPKPGKLCVKCSRAIPVEAGGVDIPHEGPVT